MILLTVYLGSRYIVGIVYHLCRDSNNNNNHHAVVDIQYKLPRYTTSLPSVYAKITPSCSHALSKDHYFAYNAQVIYSVFNNLAIIMNLHHESISFMRYVLSTKLGWIMLSYLQTAHTTRGHMRFRTRVNYCSIWLFLNYTLTANHTFDVQTIVILVESSTKSTSPWRPTYLVLLWVHANDDFWNGNSYAPSTASASPAHLTDLRGFFGSTLSSKIYEFVEKSRYLGSIDQSSYKFTE